MRATFAFNVYEYSALLMSSEGSSSDDGSGGNVHESASENDSTAEQQQQNIVTSSDDDSEQMQKEGENPIFCLANSIDGIPNICLYGKGFTAEKSRSPLLERRNIVSAGSDDDSDAPSERCLEAEEDSDVLSERQPLPAVSDDSDAVSERELDEAKESDDSEKDAANTSKSSSEEVGEEKQGLKDIALSESDSDKESDEERKELTEDDIVGPRLYPDPEAGVADTERLEPTIVEVNTARICPKFTDEGLYFVKFPNFLSIEPRPFDQDHYEDEFDEDDLLDEEGRARLKLRVENTIRWRYILDDDGNIQKQGNSKIVRWSDGTMSLYLGGEIFDIMVQPMQLDNHLFLRQGAGLQGHAVFKQVSVLNFLTRIVEKLVFRPHSTDSITHRKVTLSMADRSNKSQKVKVLTAVGSNPESKKAEIVRKEEERMRAQSRREAQQRRNRMRPSLGRSGLTANFLEDRDEDSEEESISAIKNRYKHGLDDRPLIGHSDSEDSDSKRLHDAKKDSEDSDSEQERRKQKKKKVVIEDDDEEEN
ncbi:Leo1-like protein [Onchocerca flexuosa]|uniref:Leo1-like protein n=1 Tax=Onchocerca flexuosa TaxID=387005 RepID=A0A238BYC7_9BILA|nr:Leo1-like protein [Onchocerca flexuosa]